VRQPDAETVPRARARAGTRPRRPAVGPERGRQRRDGGGARGGGGRRGAEGLRESLASHVHRVRGLRRRGPRDRLFHPAEEAEPAAYGAQDGPEDAEEPGAEEIRSSPKLSFAALFFGVIILMFLGVAEFGIGIGCP